MWRESEVEGTFWFLEVVFLYLFECLDEVLAVLALLLVAKLQSHLYIPGTPAKPLLVYTLKEGRQSLKLENTERKTILDEATARCSVQ